MARNRTFGAMTFSVKAPEPQAPDGFKVAP